MKTTIILLAVLLIVSHASAQKLKEADVPAPVKSAITKKYPGAKLEKWEKEGADFEAEFDLNKVESSSVFDTNGNFKEFEQEIKIAELPATVREYCAKTYAGYKLKEAAKITDSTGNVRYEAEMSKGKEEMELLFDEKGNFLKKSETEFDEDGKD